MIKWTKEQDDYLRAKYCKVPADEIGDVIGKTADAIYSRAGKLSLRHQAAFTRGGKICHKWSADDVKLLIKWHRKKTQKELGKMFGDRSWHTVAKKMRDLGLTKRMAHYEGKVWIRKTQTGRLQVRIFTAGKMMSYAQWVWFKHYPEIPEGKVVVPKDGNPLHCRRIEDLTLISRRLQLYKNHPRLTAEEAVAYDLIAEIKDLHNIKRRRN